MMRSGRDYAIKMMHALRDRFGRRVVVTKASSARPVAGADDPKSAKPRLAPRGRPPHRVG